MAMPLDSGPDPSPARLIALGGDYEPYPGRVSLTFEDAGGQLTLVLPLEDARRLCYGLDALLADFDAVRVRRDPDLGSADVSFDVLPDPDPC
jgi:hypothetical protein